LNDLRTVFASADKDVHWLKGTTSCNCALFQIANVAIDQKKKKDKTEKSERKQTITLVPTGKHFTFMNYRR
jgi:hypothetical protein